MLIVLASPFAGKWALPLILAILLVAVVYITVWSYPLSRAVPAKDH